MSEFNPCLSCGACCAFFRVSFYWAEADDATPGGVPVALTEELPPHLRFMKGTNQKALRCVALEGEIGSEVRCSIYPQRSNTCRNFWPSWERGKHNAYCDRARAGHGMLPLLAVDWPLEMQGVPTDGISIIIK